MKKRFHNEAGAGCQQIICCSDKGFNKSIFENIIIIVPSEEIKPFYKRAMEIMKNIDPDDAVFLALSLCSPNDGIWTEDAHFEKQDVSRVWKTTEVMEILGIKKI